MNNLNNKLADVFANLTLAVFAAAMIMLSIYTEYPGATLKTASSFKLPISRPVATYEDAHTYVLEVIHPGDTFYIYREYCFEGNFIFGAYITRYLENIESVNKARFIVPLGFMPITGHPLCGATSAPFTIPNNIPIGTYYLRAEIVYKNIVGIAKVIPITPIVIHIE